MRPYPERPKDKKYSQKECKEITKSHRKSVLRIMDIFCDKLKILGKSHDKDKESPRNLKTYTYLLNHPEEKNINQYWKNIHNHKNTHHIEGFLECSEPKLQDLVEMICDQVAAALARNAKYEDIFEEHKKRYIKKGLPENLAIICTNTFIDLWNAAHNNK